MAKTIISRVYIIYKVYPKTHCKVTMKKVTHVKSCIKAPLTKNLKISSKKSVDILAGKKKVRTFASAFERERE